MLKKAVMRQYWRVQQSQTLISMTFWVTTLTLLTWPYVSWRFDGDSSTLGISSTYWGLFSIGLFVIFCVMMIGWFYDVIFSLWRDHMTVIQERNPYSTYMLNGPIGSILAQTNEILKRLGEDDEEIVKHTQFVDRWLAWNSEQELWKRTMDGFTDVMGDEDPSLLHFSEKGES
ncbi:MAG TPA: hypothetical protein HA247_02265 [Candidatus Thalassarchaeaceae archaeon]|nr:MAG TPA: hypothetical protein D7H98_02285 [Candidatus Poseidoniales archaeon]HII89821.1 hypothetical protein [Candidatus Thalassarchaeaceae archaeon]